MKSINFKFRVNAPKIFVWHKLTTTVGIESFLSPNTYIEWTPGGSFEIYFNMDEAKGRRGTEGMIILSMEEESHLSFTWNHPIDMKSIRKQRTVVTFFLEEDGEGTLISFENSGYGHGDVWNKSYDYFKRAWGSIVLPRLIYALECEAIDWEAVQDVSQYDLNT